MVPTMKAITDPDLIAQLEGNTATGMGQPITDPNLIAQLEGSMQAGNTAPAYNLAAPPSNVSMSQLTGFGQDPNPIANTLKDLLAGSAQTGHAILNSPANIAQYLATRNVISPQSAQAVPRLPNYDYAQMVGAPNTPQDEVFQSLAKNLPLALTPEADFGAATQAVSNIPMIGNYAAGAMGRILPQAGVGAITNENPAKGMEHAAATQAMLEALTAPVRAVSQVADWMVPQQAAGSIAEQIRTNAQAAKSAAEEKYAPVHDKYDDNLVTPTPVDYLGFHPEDTQYFKPAVNRAYRDFKAEPTFLNLHNLQSEMGKQPELAPLRDSVKQKLQSYLSQDSVNAANYQAGSDIMRDNYYPYTENKTLNDIVEHEKPITKFNPTALQDALNKSSVVDQASKSLIPSNHPLVQMSQQLNGAVNRGNIAQVMIPAAGMGALGYGVHPEFGTLGGALGGAAFGKWMEPYLISKFIQNPSVENFFTGAAPYYYGAGRQIGAMQQ